MIKSEGGHQCPHCPLPLQNYSHGKFQSSKPLFQKNSSPSPLSQMSSSSSLYSTPSKPRHKKITQNNFNFPQPNVPIDPIVPNAPIFVLHSFDVRRSEGDPPSPKVPIVPNTRPYQEEHPPINELGVPKLLDKHINLK